MTRLKYIVLIVLVIAIVTTVIVAVVLPSLALPVAQPKISPSVTRLNITAVVLGFGDFADRVVEELSGRVDKVIVYSNFTPEILRYAGRSTVVVLSSEWLELNADREEVKEMIRAFADSGSMIYVNGTRAGVLQKMIYEMWYEEGKASGMSPEALQELRERMESIPKESRTGMGYMKVSEKHEVFVSGSLEDALKTLAEYRGSLLTK
ncbi:hypothetical protein Igag_0703 [Ignisphaera aggregans DSM 17230]|uniref:Uncharacterized protein n=1 Tax=Ignisphaera aggregans (strain DSM 17230 / JCM 13409 / AQ1.S1) TaxID=583356 RepID=E0SSY3_IGNAA|nr:hypothetical protein Igag_0703 [Ignisphaera aggregans DSM 17230]